MFKLFKGGQCLLPETIGRMDVLTVFDKICRIDREISTDGLWDVEVIDCEGTLICPGFIDQHVHITGGGGEEGPESRIPEIKLGDIITAGVCTVVGLLGADSITRNVAGLYAKAKGLEAEGISTYIYTGSYGVPTATLSGKVVSDMVFIDKVIGVGEIAISDYRSTHQTTQQMRELAWEAKVGGMIGRKAGIMHIHVGDGKGGIDPLLELINNSDFPVEMFVPTHLNRKAELFSQAVEYARAGGNIDLTAGEKNGPGYCVADSMELLVKSGINMDLVTITSDGNGSMPAASGGVGKVSQLMEDLRECVLRKGLETRLVLKTVTENAAKRLKLYPAKGCIAVGSDADLTVLKASDLTLSAVVAKGMLLMKDGNIIKKGKYEY